MAIEQDIKRIADALESLVEIYSSNADVKVEAKQEPIQIEVPVKKPVSDKKPAKTSKRAEVVDPIPADEPAETIPTLDDLSDVLREVLAIKSPAEAKALINKYGAQKLSEVKPTDYKALYADFVKLKG